MTYLKYLFTLLAVSFLSFSGFSQDEEEEMSSDEMILNGSFELAETGGLKKFEMIEAAENWRSATYIKADLFSETAKGDAVSIPDNAYGSQATIDGSNYAGFRAYTKDSKKQRTYVTADLTDQMEKDKMYCISINVSLADLSKYAVNNIGVLVSKGRVQKGDSKSIIRPDFQVKNKLNTVIEEREGWATICGTYTAKGGEGAIVIGCFEKDDKLQIEKLKKPSGMPGIQSLDAYYYLENVEVRAVDAKSQCACGDEKIKDEVIYSPPFVKFDELSSEEKIAASTVYFGQETSKISPIAKRDLKRFAEFLKANPSIKLELVGHMDLDEFNESKIRARLANIGEQRGESVLNYFVSQGIDKSRFTIKDKAASAPVSKYKTPTQLAKNRRVEFVLK